MPFIITTPVGGLEMPSISFDGVPPGSSYKAAYGTALEIVVKNTDNAARTSRVIEALQFGTQDLYDYVLFSLDDVTYSPSVVIGEFSALEEKSVYMDLVVPVDAVTGSNRRARLNLRPGT